MSKARKLADLIDGSNDVGIGTNNPDTKLHVFADSAGDMLTLESGNASTVPNIVWKNTDGQKAEIAVSDDSDLVLRTGSANETRMVVAGNGYVGIGNNSPDKPFEVTDNLTTYSNYISTAGDLHIRTTGSADMLQLVDAGATNETEANAYMEFHYSNGIGASATRLGYIGYSSINHSDIVINNQTTSGNIQLITPGEVSVTGKLNNHGVAKAFVLVQNHSVINKSYNVSSFVNLGTGKGQINFSSNMSNSEYIVASHSEDGSGFNDDPLITKESGQARNAATYEYTTFMNGNLNNSIRASLVFFDKQ